MKNEDGSFVVDVPEGCEPAPGFILAMRNGHEWMTSDGRVTDQWRDRGVWSTAEAANEAMSRFLDGGMP